MTTDVTEEMDAAPPEPEGPPGVPAAGPDTAGDVEGRYALSPLQQGMLFNWLRDPHAGVGLEQITCTLIGIDLSLFRRAWGELIGRHAALRTGFRWLDVDAPVQEVWRDVPLAWSEADWRDHGRAEQQERLATYLEADRRTGFDLALPPLLRFACFRTADDRWEFIWSFPHILFGDRAFVILLRELFEFYHAAEGGRVADLPPSRPYRDYIEWLQGLDPAAATAFWRRTLDGFTAPVFPEVGPVALPDQRPAYASQQAWLTRDDTAALNRFVQRHGLSVATLVQGAWAIVLSRYARTDDVVFGATRDCRRTPLDGDPAVEHMVGLLVNTLPVRVRIQPGQPVVEWLRQIHVNDAAVGVFEHAPLTDVQAASAVQPGIPLFDTLVVVQSRRLGVALDKLDPRCTWLQLREQTVFPISLHAYAETQLLLRIEFYRSRFADSAIARMLGHVAAVLRQLGNNSAGTVGDLQLLSPAERHLLAEEWNDTARELPAPPGVAGVAHPRDTALHDLLAAQARHSAGAVALEFGGHTLTYGELDARAATLARALTSHGVGPGVLVGVCMERSFDLVVALLGILKAGGAYVPLDPDYPADRLGYMLADAGCPVLLTQARAWDSSLAATIGASGAAAPAVLCLDRDWDRIAAAAATSAAPPPGAPDDVAYMIYTSGSTGKPKGSRNSHRGVVNWLLWMQDTYPLSPGDVMLQKTPFSFDVSLREFFWPLLCGARLVLAAPGGHRDPEYLAHIIDAHGVTVMHFVPSMLRAFLDSDAATTPTSMRLVICSGEALPYELQERFFAQFPATRLLNFYGPTEAAVEVTHWECRRGDARPIVPIGRPVANTHVHVLDATMRPVPIGVAGELYIGGVQVGAGYHRRPELTAERFVPDVVASGAPEGARLYRTGDLARWLDDGAIEYLGRLDFQVKLRGFRIEVGEIESALMALDAVRDCAVALRSDPGIEPRLVAYVVPASSPPPATAHLRAALGRSLPSHMVPSVFVEMDALPLSPAGKLDRKALPAPDQAKDRAASVAPRDDIESRVLAIWEQVLGDRGIGVTDHFNDVGGHSLAAVKVFSRIAKEFGRQIPLVTMLKHDTIEQLAALLREPAREAAWRCVVPFTTTGAGRPIWCLHAQTGNVLIYQHFANAMRGLHPVYGIQAIGNWGAQEPQESVEEMARYYVDEVLKVQPRGPYIIFGMSMGGWMALELARLLIERGHTIEMLAMYDTEGPGYPRLNPYGRVVKFVREHGGISFGRLRRIANIAPPRPGAPPKRFRVLRSILWNLRDTARWWVSNTRRDWLTWKYEHRNPPQGFEFPANVTRFRLATRRITARYHARFYPGKITLFRARIQATGAIPDPTNGWAGLSSGIEMYEMEGGHQHALFGKPAEDFAALFRRCLGK